MRKEMGVAKNRNHKPIADCDKCLGDGADVREINLQPVQATVTGCLHVPIVGPTGRSDWSVRRSDRRSEESNMFDFVRLPIRLSKRVDTTSDWSDRLASRTTNHAAA